MIVSQKLLFSLLLIGAVASSHATLLTNGDFSGGTSGTLVAGSATGGVLSVPTGWQGFATGDAALQVSADLTKFSAGNQPVGSWVQQSVTTTAGLWYQLTWDQTGNQAARTSVTPSFWNGTDTSSAADYEHQFHWTGARQTLFRPTGTSTTLRVSDVGSNTTSSDTNIDNLVLDVANGLINIAPAVGIPSFSSQFGNVGTGWGDPNNAIDGGVANSNYTVFHGNVDTGGDYYELNFGQAFTLQRLEIASRVAANNDRIGTQIELFDAGGGSIDIIPITASLLFSADGYWNGVQRVRVTDADSHLNIAELRTFTTFVNGVAIPEPSSALLLGFGLLLLTLRRTFKA